MRKSQILKLYRSGIHSAREIARKLGRGTRAESIEVQRILSNSDLPIRKIWTDDHLAYLKAHYPTTTRVELAHHLHRSTSSIDGMAHTLKLHRLDNPGNIRKGEHRGLAQEFFKGQLSWNLGKKIGSHGRSKETQFKKGQKSHTELFDGAITIRIDHKDRHNRKYKWIRISKNRWKMLHVHIFEHFEGPIPPGHIVVFADGDSSNCRLDNLRCISRTQHAHETQMKDGYIAARLASKWIDGRPGIDRDLYRQILKNPALIEVKRRQMQLKRAIREQS